MTGVQKFKHPWTFSPGDRVKVYDRFRLAEHEVTGTVAKVSPSGFGVMVDIDNEFDFLLAERSEDPFWVHPFQLRHFPVDPELDSEVFRTCTFAEVRGGLFQGKEYYRLGWNGKGMKIALQCPDTHSKMTQPYVYLVTGISIESPAGTNNVPWLASQTDLLADDWVVWDWAKATKL